MAKVTPSPMNPARFYKEVVEGNLEDMNREPASPRYAANLAWSVAHLGEHICRYEARAQGVAPKWGEFLEALRNECDSYKVLYAHSIAWKHLYPDQPKILEVVASAGSFTSYLAVPDVSENPSEDEIVGKPNGQTTEQRLAVVTQPDHVLVDVLDAARKALEHIKSQYPSYFAE